MYCKTGEFFFLPDTYLPPKNIFLSFWNFSLKWDLIDCRPFVQTTPFPKGWWNTQGTQVKSRAKLFHATLSNPDVEEVKGDRRTVVVLGQVGGQRDGVVALVLDHNNNNNNAYQW